MGLVERPDPLTPEAQVAVWRAEGHSLKALSVRVRTPEIRAVILQQLEAEGREAQTPKASVATQAVTCGG